MASRRIKSPNEDLIWATAYSIATCLVTLAEAKERWSSEEALAEHIDKRATAIADKATERLRGKIQ